MIVRPRSVWTTRTNAWSRPLVRDRVTDLVIHWPGSSVLSYRKSEVKLASIIRGFETYHVSVRGWPGIGYSYLIDWEGRVWEGAGDRVAAHSATARVPDKNQTSIGVQLVLGTQDDVTPAMRRAVAELYESKKTLYPRLSRITDHRSVPGASTQCPGNRAHDAVNRGVFYPGGIMATLDKEDLANIAKAVWDYAIDMPGENRKAPAWDIVRYADVRAKRIIDAFPKVNADVVRSALRDAIAAVNATVTFKG